MSCDHVYTERNRIAVALAKLALQLGYRAGVSQHQGEDWEDDWRTVLYIDLPTQQVSWHLHDSEKYLLDGLPAYEGGWDGHDTNEKYRRLEAL